MEEIKREKCGKCVCWREPAEFLNDKGRRMKTCSKCRALARKARDKYKCEHGRQKYQCRECGGSEICEHNRIKSACKKCGGGRICEHDRIRSTCKNCGGSQICEHDRLKSTCKSCGGSQICEHDRIRSACKNCNPDGHLKSVVHKSKYRIDWTNQEKKSMVECLGCDIQTYRDYLESKFKAGMTWENYGQWEIDHIIPLNYGSPSFEEAFSRLHYTNTQPLWKEENLAKGNKLIPLKEKA